MILLLDIDGVLNSAKFRDDWILAHPDKKFNYLLDPAAIKYYKQFIDTYKPKVFLVSAWRTDKKALNYLYKHGFNFDGIMSPTENRVCYAVNLACKYPTELIILLDDDTKKLPKINNLSLVHVDWKQGLKLKHIKKIEKIIKKWF